MGASAYDCGVIQHQFANPNAAGGGRAQLTRSFHVYLELTMQSKHDRLIYGYCLAHQVEGRRQDGTQIPATAGATALARLGGFYVTRAQTAAAAAAAHMVGRWQAPQVQGRQVFRQGERVDAAVQAVQQADGYYYELSYWYDGTDIYVLFHCYP
jgi:hypothetical protein